MHGKMQEFEVTEVMCEPSDIQWENLAVDPIEKLLRNLFF